jgi:hypothetical protein
MSGEAAELDRWIEAADAALAGVALPCPGSYRVDLVAETDEGDLWRRLVVTDGVVAGWERRDGGPDDGTALRQPWALQQRMLARAREGNDALAASWVEERRGGEVTRTLRPPPLDLMEAAGWRHLVRVPNATLVAQHVLRATPFGIVKHVQRIVDGIEVESVLGETDDADILLDRRYFRVMTQRYLGGPALDTMEGGRAAGDWPKLMTLAGIADSPEAEEADARGIGGGLELGVLGELLITPEYKAFAQAPDDQEAEA